MSSALSHWNQTNLYAGHKVKTDFWLQKWGSGLYAGGLIRIVKSL